MSAPQPKLKTLTLEPPLGGWIPDFWGIPDAALQGAKNQYTISFGTSLFRQERFGHIAPAETFTSGSITDASSYFNSLPRAVAVDVTQTPNVYWYLCGGLSGTAPRLVKVVTGATTSSRDITAINNFTTLPSGGTGFWGEDVIFYTGAQSSTPTPMILYSWNDSGTGAVGMYNISTSSFVSDDFFSTTYFSGQARPSAGVPHRLCEGPAKIAYMTNGQYVLSYDGSGSGNGTYTPQALNCGVGWVSVDICKYQNYIAILCIKNGTSYNSFTSKSETKVLLWDGTNAGANATPNFAYDVDDNFATALINADQLYCFSQGLNNTTKIKYLPIAYGVSKFQTLYQDSTLNIGNAPDPRSVSRYNGAIVWWGISPNEPGAINAFIPGQGFHQPYIANDGTNTSTTNGFLGNITGKQLSIGMLSGSTYEVVYLDGEGAYFPNGEHRTALIDLPYRTTIHRVILYFSKFDSTSSLIVSLFKDYHTKSIGSSNDMLNTTVTTTTFPEILSNFACSIRQLIPDVSSFYLNYKFNHSSPTAVGATIRKVEVIYEEVDKP